MKKLYLIGIMCLVSACGDATMSFVDADSAWDNIDYSAYKQTVARAPIQNGKPVYINAISLSGNLSTSLPSSQD